MEKKLRKWRTIYFPTRVLVFLLSLSEGEIGKTSRMENSRETRRKWTSLDGFLQRKILQKYFFSFLFFISFHKHQVSSVQSFSQNWIIFNTFLPYILWGHFIFSIKQFSVARSIVFQTRDEFYGEYKINCIFIFWFSLGNFLMNESPTG